MDIVFSAHAISRMKKRGIREDEVREAIRHPDQLIKLHGKFVAKKRVSNGIIEIPYEKTEKHIKIITVYWI